MINFNCLLISLFSYGPVFSALAYITNEKDNTVSVIDVDKRKVIKTVDVGQRPRGIIMSHDGKLVLICASDDDRVESIDYLLSLMLDRENADNKQDLFAYRDALKEF